MTLKDNQKHQKHAFVAKPDKGNYARNEFSILGAHCGIIEKLVESLIGDLKNDFRCIYIDAFHGSESSSPEGSRLMDMISHHALQYEQQLNDYDQKLQLAEYDLAIANGNHFDAAKQFIIINESKKESLKRKLNRLTNISAIILDTDSQEPFDFIKEHLKGVEKPIFKINEVQKISDFIKSDIQSIPVYGLVLAGGKSSRMGQDKSLISYHGIDHQTFMANQLSSVCQDVFISKKEDFIEHLSYPVISDSFTNLGPFGALLSAFRKNPNVAWLVTACDQPLLKDYHLNLLIEKRDNRKIATCFYNPDTQFPEPLITIWEPKAYPRLLQFLALGYSCPRKVLINSDIHLIKVDDNSFMKNINTPKERAQLIIK